ncbi:hypothetical protein EJ06DRAFT_532268 [Trichodelitschia bisporula]|uniref:Uncharacterized protein n=1 Tax=Trichodelitschia bisporula TaxID=703511 RepID=A0A6G1HRI8_9PEZI|nr:hypothetical protein EJ06DRAFT_532268 [Trichodelitschia bisporula]
MEYVPVFLPDGTLPHKYENDAPWDSVRQKPRPRFVWPRDGKRTSRLGRAKDLLQGRGPDIFISTHGDRPTRGRWTNRALMDPFLFDNTNDPMPWAKRDPNEQYDFLTRRYRAPQRWTWSDAKWPLKDADRYMHPLAFRCEEGDWFQLRNMAPFPGHFLPGHNMPFMRRPPFA